MTRTVYYLLSMYDGKPIVPITDVRRDFFSHLNEAQFLRKVGSGEIRLPVIRIEHSQKSAKGVHVEDLARYLDDRTAVARKEAAEAIGA